MLVTRLAKMVRRISLILSILVVLYLGTGLVFHFKWKSALAACRETRRAQGEFVEPEVFGGVLGLVFDVSNWPVYSWANVYHHGTLLATPCTHSDNEKVNSASEDSARYGVGRPWRTAGYERLYRSLGYSVAANKMNPRLRKRPVAGCAGGSRCY